jgi:16S rRNA (cytosine967-C5)-methyltransferase
VRPGEQPAVEAALAAAGIGFTRHARLAGALAVPASSPLRALAPRLRGAAEVQDLASQAVGVVCAASPGSRWWDVCSGSGGKALHLAEQVGRTGAVLATEVRPGSLRELDRRVCEAGAAAVQPRAWDGAADPAPGREFDGVLVDAPCSGLGTWHRNPDARWRTPAGEIERCVRLQDTLLRLGADKVRRGGVLVYATCTLAAAENDEVADRFLTERADFTAEPFEHPLTGERTPGRLCIRPWDGPGNGMFVARLRRA